MLLNSHRGGAGDPLVLIHGIGSRCVPVTVAWGEHDRLLLPRQALRAANAIPAARLRTLTGCGHVPTYDDPGQVAEVLLDGSRSG